MRDLFPPCLQLLENLQLCGGKFCNSEKSQDHGNLMPHSVTSLPHTSQNSRTSYGIAYKMRDFSAKALVHSVYLLTLVLRNVYKVLSNSEKQVSFPVLLSPFLLSPLRLPISPLLPSHFLSLCLAFCLHHRPMLPSKRSRATFTLVSSINSWEFQ